jgi:hypothetical protein
MSQYCHEFRVYVTNNNGFWIGWLELLALLYSLNSLLDYECLLFCVTNDEQRIPLLLNSPGLNYLPGEPNLDDHLQQFVHYSVIICVLSVGTKSVWRPATQQRRSHCWLRNLDNVFSEPLSNNGHIRHNIKTKKLETTLAFEPPYDHNGYERNHKWGSDRMGKGGQLDSGFCLSPAVTWLISQWCF